MTLRLEFERGTLLLHDTDSLPEGLSLPGCEFDDRVKLMRAPAIRYYDIVMMLVRNKIEYIDNARDYETLDLKCGIERTPFPYQSEAVDTWWSQGRRGVVVLPTGAGKTFVSQMAMMRSQRSTLVVTPTIDLMQQWHGVLSSSFEIEVGLIGGGYYDPKPVTVTTYDSAYIHMERLGGMFGLLVFDEVHHLPGPSYAFSAEASIAPFRLGLTATPERQDGEERRLLELIGPTVYRRDITELSGEYLAEYETVQIEVKLSDDEQHAYETNREIYRDFVNAKGISMGRPGGWQRFLMESSRSEEGRRAFMAYRTQKSIAQASGAKVRMLGELLTRHRHDRMIIFTAENEAVYRISRKFLIPAITHQTKAKERQEILERFNAGTYPFLVTSRVLNEGVDVPAANVGVVLSGSGSVREHVQRLGRILRRAENKLAILYEVITQNTAEQYVSERRRQHSAYGGPS